jgi:hypothetical protein
MIVLPWIRAIGLNAATASSRVETRLMFVRSRPSRTRWTISLSWARSDSTTEQFGGIAPDVVEAAALAPRIT